MMFVYFYKYLFVSRYKFKIKTNFYRKPFLKIKKTPFLREYIKSSSYSRDVALFYFMNKDNLIRFIALFCF